MDIGLLLNLNNYTVDPATFARSVEDCGFESMWVGDHPVMPVTIGTPKPGNAAEVPEWYSHVCDPFVALSMAAATTTSIKLGIGVCIVPNRHPVLTALQAASLDCFSGGRLLFGVGAGWLREEMDVMGGDFPHRNAQAEEYVAAMRRLWTETEASFEGRWIRFPALRMNPRPSRPGGPPILLGMSGPRSAARVAAWGDGWIPVHIGLDDLRVGRKRLEDECQRIGRDVDTIDITVFEYEQGLDRTQAREMADAFAEAGADRLVLIQGMRVHAGAPDWTQWSHDEHRARLEDVAERYL